MPTVQKDGSAEVNRTYIIVVLLSAGAACWLSGCAEGQVYSHNSGRLLPGAVSPRKTWRISGDLKDLNLAIDGRLGTAAVSEPGYRNATITLDLSKPCMFNMVVIDHGRSRDGYCRRVAILTSMDGKNFTLRHARPGTRRITTLLLPSFVFARYVRLRAVGEGERQWSIAEMYLQ